MPVLQTKFFIFPCEFWNPFKVLYLEDNEDAADDAGVSIDHGLFHNVTDAAQVMGFNGMLLAQKIADGEVVAGCQEVELVNAHGTNMVQ